jgi:membrane associated rhomboid family serine protease
VIEQQDFQFLQAFWTRRAIVAYSLFAFNIIVFVLMSFAGGSENEVTLLAFGAKQNLLIDNGEIWRFITPIFIHIGLLHLAFNSYALWIVGPQVEKLYGGPRFLTLYLLTGVAGVAASYGYHPYVLSAGASGAIFGLFGVLLVFSIKYRKTIPAFFSQALGKGILLTVGINLAIGWFIPQVDLAAHVGGFIAGGLLAVAIPFARPGESEHPFFKFLQVALVAVVAVSFFEVATHYSGPGLSVPSLSPGRGNSTGTFISSMNQAQEAFEHSEMELESGNPGLLPVVEKELGQAIDAMSEIPHLSASADKLSSQLLDLLRKQHAYVKEVEQTGRTRSDFIGASPQSARYKRLKSAIEEWVDQEGAAYGIQNSK